MGDPTKNSTFEACQQFLRSAAATKHTPNSSRGVKRLHLERKGKGKGKAKKDKANAKKKDGPPAEIKAGKYSAADFRALSRRTETRFLH